VCFIGDDLPDLPAIRRVGLGAAVADAAPEVRAAAQFVTNAAGGRGAVRELIETILKAQGRWDEIVEKYE
jgi:YrbI family 3-deoxy-D-manno-octulosonate 8-phosphate phosphatase